MIKKLKSLNIKELEIADPYTIFVKPLEKMAVSLKDTYDHVISKYSSEQPAGNLTDDMIEIIRMVKNTVSKICMNKDILDLCFQMKVLNDNRLFNHAIHTSVFSGIVAGALNLKDDMFDIMVGGLLQNIGCVEMPFLIGIEKRKSQEELLWREHPSYGYYFTIQNNISRSIAEIILQHHENWDGTGYPKKLKGEAITLGARIVNVCSSVSRHIHFDHMQPYETMEYLYCGSNVFFDSKIVDTFISNITLYPLGALVRLTTDEVGIISNVRYNRGPRPIVMVYFNRFNKPLSEPIKIDLGKERTIFIEEILD